MKLLAISAILVGLITTSAHATDLAAEIAFCHIENTMLSEDASSELRATAMQTALTDEVKNTIVFNILNYDLIVGNIENPPEFIRPEQIESMISLRDCIDQFRRVPFN